MRNSKNLAFAPVIKWSGSKRHVAQVLSKLVPNANRYFEPFVGGGAMLPFRKITNGVASDIIPELIALWEAIKTNPEQTAYEYQIRWERLQTEGYQVYYEVRNNFNKTKNAFDFLFLTRTCVNGLIRYNEKGEFNNSFHLTRPGIKPKTLTNLILKWSGYLKDIIFLNIDYRETLEAVTRNDFVFLDPPYGGTKDRYTRSDFDLYTFYKQLDMLNTIGAKWLLTFDGFAGNREYSYEVPKEIYQHKIFIKTGNSPFTKMMKTTVDAVYESVYFNFDPSTGLPTQVSCQNDQKLALFSHFDM
ncbi:MAG: Dam family site-specific DNA-(adenine-N6)-methyltransferase [Candidatus Omnitrophica bacterium]|nr:Dam family site-specific DNA-(adenine-N6)-methyltransferase [Candidatus Omnitrophota bacterium]